MLAFAIQVQTFPPMPPLELRIKLFAIWDQTFSANASIRIKDQTFSPNAWDQNFSANASIRIKEQNFATNAYIAISGKRDH